MIDFLIWSAVIVSSAALGEILHLILAIAINEIIEKENNQ